MAMYRNEFEAWYASSFGTPPERSCSMTMTTADFQEFLLRCWKSATVAAMSDVKAIIRATIEEVLGVRGERIAEKLPVWNQYLREYVPGQPIIAHDRPPGSQRP